MVDKLTELQRAMLGRFGRRRKVARWELASDGTAFRTFQALERRGLIEQDFGALGSPVYVAITPAGRKASAVSNGVRDA